MTKTPTPVVLVTGASRGIGLAVVQQLVEGTKVIAPARVVAMSRSVSPGLRALADSPRGESLLLVQGDVTSDADNARVVHEAVARWDRLDALVLNAGTFADRRLSDMASDDFRQVMDTNVTSLVSILRPAIPHLRQTHGRVVFLSSGAAMKATAAWASYNASKAAANAISRTLANEEPDIACFAVRPGVVDTDMVTSIRSSKAMDPQEQAKFLEMKEQNRLAQPDEPAHVLAALAVNGTRSNPQVDGQPLGATGGFVSFDDPALEAFAKK
ncbi:hypothetical protein MSPP1_003570 [Malassezia sp. CBS 17886]|nr:hypothetical protein MSPP1_003570 [Malassezia sp. CBS 17886]